MTRRRFLGGVAGLSAASSVRRSPDAPHIVVVGGGAFGQWTATELDRRGARATVVDAYGPGSPRSSSGGESRVIRAVYGPDRIYVEMVGRSYELWSELIDASSEALYTETGALWMHRGDDAYVRSSLSILEEFGFPVDRIDLEAAARRWPQIDLSGVRSIYLERRAGVLAARRCVRQLHRIRLERGEAFERARAEPGPIASERLEHLRLGDGRTLEADAYVFACGPWLGSLFPEVVGDRIRASRQEVYYFGPPAGDDSFGPRRMPTWIDFGDRITYGLPDTNGRGFKVADDTRGPTFDPDTGDRTPTHEGIDRVRTLLAERFPKLRDAPLLESRVCQYENSPDGHLIVDRHPEATNLWLVGGGSGHGFKLAPAVGELVSEHILEERPVESKFALARLNAVDRSATQFESRAEGE